MPTRPLIGTARWSPRPAQSDDSQRWILAEHAVVYLVRRRSSGRFPDAFGSATNQFRVVTRTAQHDSSQHWVFDPVEP